MRTKITKMRLLLLSALVLAAIAVPAAAYAVSGYTMTYLPGTSDTVANMPDAGSGTGGAAYVTSKQAPTREGYEFMGWVLAYEEEEPTKPASYTVRYLEEGTEMPLVDDKIVSDAHIGDTVAEKAVEITDYELLNEATQELVLEEGGNEIVFYYRAVTPQPKLTSYEIHYVNEYTWADLIDPLIVNDQLVGTEVTVESVEIEGYETDEDTKTFTLQEDPSGNIHYFPYYCLIV